MFTARNQVKAIYANGPPPLATFTYDLNGNRLSLVLNNGVTNGYAYDNASRLTAIVANQGANPVASFAYTYNNINDRTALVREGGRTENYGYDAARQLTGATYGDTTFEGFNYDAMGNLNTRTNVQGGTDTFMANNLNQYTAVNGNATSFDAKGNLLSWTGGAFGYDAQNRLVGASRGTNGAIFVYDGRNRAVQRIINGTTTTFIYDGWDLIAEYSGTTPIAEYIHGPGTDETLARATAIGTVYYTVDALNSVATLTDGSGNVVEKYRYTAFGQPTIYDATGTNILFESAYGNRFAFQGREWFAEINLTDHRNRYYSPELNRWLNRDPSAEKGGINLYYYVWNNPIGLIDSLGLQGSLPINNNNVNVNTPTFGLFVGVGPQINYTQPSTFIPSSPTTPPAPAPNPNNVSVQESVNPEAGGMSDTQLGHNINDTINLWSGDGINGTDPFWATLGIWVPDTLPGSIGENLADQPNVNGWSKVGNGVITYCEVKAFDKLSHKALKSTE